MKYKVGDKVRIKSREWYDANKDEDGNIKLKNGHVFFKEMAYILGWEVKIEAAFEKDKCYIVFENDYNITDEMMEGLVSEEKPIISTDLIKDIAEVIKTRNLGVSISENEGKLIIEPLKVEEEEDLPIDTPCMCSFDGKSWDLHYYFMRKRVYRQGYKSSDARGNIPMDYIIPCSQFNFENPEESLQYNIVKK